MLNGSPHSGIFALKYQRIQMVRLSEIKKTKLGKNAQERAK
jgi:hypothetical protein